MRRRLKWIGWTFLLLFILMNAALYIHAWSLTHYATGITGAIQDPHHLSFGQKLTVLFTGVRNPRPANLSLPKEKYASIDLRSNKRINAWLIGTPSPRGTVIMFHGFGAEKSRLLDRASVFRDSGFNTVLIDFMGSGSSEGNQTTIGAAEAAEVKTAFEFVRHSGERHIVLYGISMGSVAIMRAEALYGVKPEANILECPFGTLLKTVEARFRNMGVPPFPMAPLMVFWGGLQNGFNGFRLNPEDYARSINTPTLLMYGAKDDKVSPEETKEIFARLAGEKKLSVFPDAGHENYKAKYGREWGRDIGFALSAAVR